MDVLSLVVLGEQNEDPTTETLSHKLERDLIRGSEIEKTANQEQYYRMLNESFSSLCLTINQFTTTLLESTRPHHLHY